MQPFRLWTSDSSIACSLLSGLGYVLASLVMNPSNILSNVGDSLRYVTVACASCKSLIKVASLGGYVILFVYSLKIAVKTWRLHRRFSARVSTRMSHLNQY